MSEFSDALQGATCGLWESAPNRFLEATFGGLPAPPGRNAFVSMMNDYCNDYPGFVPPTAEAPFDGGQCPVEYDVTAQWTVKRNLTNQVFTASGTSRFLGPINLAGTQTNQGLIAGYVSTGQGLQPVTDQFDVNEWSDFSFGIQGVSRVDGQPDNCGSPPIRFPGEPQPGDDDGITINIPIEISPGVTVDVDVELLPDINNVVIPVVINNRVVAEINLGGVNFNIGGSNGGGNVDLGPVLDAIADTQGQIETTRDDLIQGQNQTNTEVNENQALIEAATEIINSVLQQVVRIGIPENLPLPGTQDLCETRNVVPNNIFNALFYISDQLRLIRQINCTTNIPGSLIGVFTSTVEERVTVFNLPEGACILEIEITNVQLPQRLSSYFVSASEGVNAKFGFCNLVYSDGSGNYIHDVVGQIWSKRTYVEVPKGSKATGLRILLEPELSVAVYDSGIR